MGGGMAGAICRTMVARVARRWSNFHGICRQVLCPERLARNSLNHCQEVFDTAIDLADQQFALPYAGD